MTKDPANFREYAGVLCAFIVVMMFGSVGFIQLAIVVFHGSPVSVPGDWSASMLSLAAAAMGFLIGKQTNGQNSAPVSVPVGDTVSTTTSVNTTDKK